MNPRVTYSRESRGAGEGSDEGNSGELKWQEGVTFAVGFNGAVVENGG